MENVKEIEYSAAEQLLMEHSKQITIFVDKKTIMAMFSCSDHDAGEFIKNSGRSLKIGKRIVISLADLTKYVEQLIIENNQ